MSRKKYKQINDKTRARATSGQALIEFVLGLMIVIGFFFFYVKMAAVFAIGNYIHYATFMAARAYASSSDSAEQQVINAENVLQKMVGGRYRSLLKPQGGTGMVPGATVGPGPYYNEDPAEDHWNQGVTFSFETNMSLYPWSRGAADIKMKLTSESWLRREESEAEVRARKAQIQSSPSFASFPSVVVEWDNGL